MRQKSVRPELPSEWIVTSHVLSNYQKTILGINTFR